MGKVLKGMALGNPFGHTDFGRPSSSGKWFARLNQNILIIVISWSWLNFSWENEQLCDFEHSNFSTETG